MHRSEGQIFDGQVVEVSGYVAVLPDGSTHIRVGPSGISLGSRSLPIARWVAPDGISRCVLDWGDGRWAPGFLGWVETDESRLRSTLQIAVDAAHQMQSADFPSDLRASWSNEELGSLCRAVDDVSAELGVEPRLVRVNFHGEGYLLAAPTQNLRDRVADALLLRGYLFEKLPPAIRLCRRAPVT